MSILVKMEFQKLTRKYYLIAGALLLVFYTAFWFFVCGVNSRATFPIHTTDGIVLEGRSAALYNKSLYEQYAGELTDEKVAEILNEFQAARENYETSHNDLYKAPEIYEDFSLFKNIEDNTSEKILSQYGYINIGALDIPEFDTPLYFTFSGAWEVAGDIFYNGSLGIALFLLISLAPLFSDEYSNGAVSVILTARYGKNKVIVAKCIVSFLVATIVVVLFSALVLILCGIYFGGLTGWQADIQTQFSSLLMPIPLRMNNLQFFMLAVLLYWLSAVEVAALTCFCSALCKRTLSTFAVSGVLYVAPFFIRQFNIGGIISGEWMLLFPIWSSKVQQVLRTSVYKNIDLLPVACEMPVWIALFTVISMFVLFFLTFKRFSEYQVTD